MKSNHESWYGKLFNVLVVLSIGGFTAVNVRRSFLEGTVLADLKLFLPFVVWASVLFCGIRFMPLRWKDALQVWLRKSRLNSFLLSLALFGALFMMLSHESVVERVFMTLGLATFFAIAGPYLGSSEDVN